MRPIEFRGKSTAYNKWVYGDLVHYADPERIYIKDAKCVLILIDPDTVGQWTGKFDVNKNKIFEDDVVRVKCYGDDELEEVDFTIQWEAESCGYIAKCYEDSYRIDDILKNDEICEDALIVGNKHDTPDLWERARE